MGLVCVLSALRALYTWSCAGMKKWLGPLPRSPSASNAAVDPYSAAACGPQHL